MATAQLSHQCLERTSNSTLHTNTLIHGDCLHVLPTLPEKSVNFILTDPPYITNYKSRDSRSVPNDDNDRWLKPAFAEMHRVLHDDTFCISFYGWPQADKFMQAYRAAGFRIVGHLVFPKRYTSSTRFLRYQHECAYLLAKGYPPHPDETVSDVIDWTYSGNKLHPTQKPLSVLLPLVETFSVRQGMVLDPFSGSGSTLAAAQMLGRNWLGIELDPKYHAIASRRLAQEGAPTRCADRSVCIQCKRPVNTQRSGETGGGTEALPARSALSSAACLRLDHGL
jgi:adenine-specific DNA-methyltransferase